MKRISGPVFALIYWSVVVIIFLLSIHALLNTNVADWFTTSEWQVLENFSTLLGVIGLIISVFISFAYSTFKRVKHSLLRISFPSELDKLPSLNYDALLFTVSKSANLPLWMINTYHPKAIALLGTEAVSDCMAKITEAAHSAGIKVCKRILDNPDQILRAKQEAQQMINALQQANFTNIAVDVTGGKVPMSIGAFLAAQENTLDTIYVSANYDEKGPISHTVRPLLLASAYELEFMNSDHNMLN